MPVYSTYTATVSAIAAAFYNTGMLAFQRAKQTNEGKMTMDFALFLSAATNLALACELGMKAILPEQKKIHYLATLFGELTPAEQKEMIDYTILDLNPVGTPENSARGKICRTRDDFMAQLQKADNNFVEARYLYDQKHNVEISFDFLQAFARSLLIGAGYDFDAHTKMAYYAV